MPRLTRFLASYRNRDTLEAALLQQGYPILISNLVDPLAQSNDQQSIPILKMLVDLDIPFSLQSRGGKRVDEVLDFIPPVVWYLSINQDDDALRKKIEPGATTIESRLALIEKLTKRGHTVLIGFNPFVKEWWRDFPAMARRVKDAGAWGCWLQSLHFNQKQLRNMTDKQKIAIGNPIVTRALKRGRPEEVAWRAEGLAAVEEAGLVSYCTGNEGRSHLFDAYRKVYKKTFPIMQDWIHYCFDRVTPDKPIVSFDEFCHVMLPLLPTGEFYIRDYIGANNRELWETFDVPTRGTFKQLLALIWDMPEMGHCPIGEPWFGYAGHKNSTQSEIFVDSQKLPFMIFSPSGFGDDEITVEASAYF